MNDLSADTASITGFAARTAAMAAEVHQAGLDAAAAQPLLSGPVFGAVGADFVTAFTSTHSAHLALIERVSRLLGAISATALANAGRYEGADAAATLALGSGAVGLES